MTDDTRDTRLEPRNRRVRLTSNSVISVGPDLSSESERLVAFHFVRVAEMVKRDLIEFIFVCGMSLQRHIIARYQTARIVRHVPRNKCIIGLVFDVTA